MSALPNPFSAFAAVVMPVAETAVVSPLPTPPDTTANPLSPGEAYGSLPSGESDPAVTLDYAPGENQPSMTMEVSQEASAAMLEPHQAADATDCTDQIHEIFRHYLNMTEPTLDELCARGFDVHAFMDDLEEMPLFLRTA